MYLSSICPLYVISMSMVMDIITCINGLHLMATSIKNVKLSIHRLISRSTYMYAATTTYIKKIQVYNNDLAIALDKTHNKKANKHFLHTIFNQ